MRPRLTSAHLISLLALFLALGGGAYAASTAKKNSVTSKSVKDGALTGADILDNSITGADIDESTLTGLAGGTNGTNGTNGDDGDDGAPGRSALTELQSGEMVFGNYSYQGIGQARTGVSLPIPAPSQIDSGHVIVIDPDSSFPSGCPGTALAPSASPGFACFYSLITDANAGGSNRFGYGTFCTCNDAGASGDGSKYGFFILGNGVTNTTIVADEGSWAYRAP